MNYGLGILCPGQGIQQPDMFMRLAKYESAAPILDAASEVLGWDIYDLPDISKTIDIFQNDIAQVLLCASSIATWFVLHEEVPVPVVFAGYSVGELAAYGCTGALAPAETFALAKQRAKLMDGCPPGGLLAIKGLNKSQIGALCDSHHLEIAIINSHIHFVLGGEVDRLECAALEATRRGAINVRILNVAVASHTSKMASAVATFHDLLVSSKFGVPGVPVLSCVAAKPVFDRVSGIDSLANQLSNTLKWSDCMNAASEMGATIFLEMLPGSSLIKMLLSVVNDASARACSEFRTLKGAADWVRRQVDQ
jgi:[acyl-carrier-protein] S-malonyltransferase